MTALMDADSLDVTLGRRRVLDDVAFAVRPGEAVGLVGPNGAGKTTLLRALAGVLRPERGAVHLDGAPVEALPRGRFAAKVAYLPQGGGSFWAVPVRTLVMLGRLPHRNRWSGPSPADEAAVTAALAATGTQELADRPVTELSGGERARVLLARALAGEPRLLLADEPVSGLDPYHRLEVMEHLRALARAGKAVVVVLHDLTLAARFCDRLVLLDGGRVAASGAPAEVLTPERLDSVYRVRALHGRENGEPFVVPWDRLPERHAPESPEGGR
jgi:iron complex transport system ATP-binding protein